MRNAVFRHTRQVPATIFSDLKLSRWLKIKPSMSMFESIASRVSAAALAAPRRRVSMQSRTRQLVRPDRAPTCVGGSIMSEFLNEAIMRQSIDAESVSHVHVHVKMPSRQDARPHVPWIIPWRHKVRVAPTPLSPHHSNPLAPPAPPTLTSWAWKAPEYYRPPTLALAIVPCGWVPPCREPAESPPCHQYPPRPSARWASSLRDAACSNVSAPTHASHAHAHAAVLLAAPTAPGHAATRPAFGARTPAVRSRLQPCDSGFPLREDPLYNAST